MRLADLPIRRKLTFVIVVTSALGLSVAAASFIGYEWVSARGAMESDLSTLAGIVASNGTAALTFDDPATAEELLLSLSGNSSILAGCLYEPSGAVFADFVREGSPIGCDGSPGMDRSEFGAVALTVARGVILDGERIGTVVLRQDLAPLWNRLRSYLGITGVVMLLSLLASFALSAVLQKVISEPILRLSDTVRQVSETRDFSLRARQHGGDEVGTLITGFNDMLAEIQRANRGLQRAHDELEARVEERTRELQLEIMERRRAEQHLKDSADKLERSNRDLQDFAYVASHDLQEPLRKIQAFGDRLMKTCSDDLGERGLDYVERMQNAAGRMRTLITDVLAFSRVTTRARPFEAVDLGALVEEVKTDLEYRIEETGTVLDVEPLEVIDADPSQLRQVVQNLITNAIKFHKPGETPHIRISGHTPDASGEGGNGSRGEEYYVLRFQDAGIGFDPKHSERIFGMFSRLHGRGEYEGTGVGLAICRKIVERHGGEIIAESEPGEGASFSIRLPRSQPRDDPAAAE